MTTKFFALIAIIGFAGVYVARAQSPTPGKSPSPSPTPAKHRAVKKAQGDRSGASDAVTDFG